MALLSRDGITHNVWTAYLFTLFYWSARSILFQQVVAGYVFVLTQSNKPVGIVKGIQGISQLLFSLPGGYFADRTRRDTILKISGVVGVVGAVITFFSVELTSLSGLYVAFGLWGLFSAFQSPAMEALFADSIPPGKRSFPFMIKYNISNLAQMLGPLLSILLFVFYGDEWQLPELKPVLEFGCVLGVVASLILFQFNDDRAKDYIQNKNMQEKEQQELLESSMVTPSPIRTPKLVGNGNEIDMVYDYPDEDDITVDEKSPPTVTENTALLLLKGKTAQEMDLERQQRQQEVEDDEEGYMAHLDAKFLCFRTKHVPYILFASDFVISNGAGMTINFFPLFFKEEYGLTPIHVCALFMSQPLVVMILSFLAQRLSKPCGRMPIIAFTRAFSVACLFSMAYAQPMVLQIVLFLMRGGMMRCSQPLRRSILMDYVPKNIRARWNALEGLSVFSWSGSAVLGGFLIDAYGYRMCFIITSFVYVAGLSMEMFLLPLTKHAVEK
ncbi:hypothetical protein PHYBOEH_006553 [Phytophthora boehmeriae]|uniref:Major facilitator superfamily (MFS) profile domain-containing protein n=1 Tax=Phytophthora boehmeriae TaxID=109152 RepID=A0A8T1X2Q2_9STRA|nr:hypothetical protein PHYBOEH_006553 [Phytophthora boehmeriae]